MRRYFYADTNFGLTNLFLVPPYMPVQNLWFNPNEINPARFPFPTGFDNVFQDGNLDDQLVYPNNPTQNNQHAHNQQAPENLSVAIPKNEPFYNITNSSVSTIFTKRFCLEQQPHEVQRKSYKNENR